MNYRCGHCFLKEASAFYHRRLLNFKSVNVCIPGALLRQPHFTSQKWKSTLVTHNDQKPSIIRRIIKKVGISPLHKSKLKRTSYFLYENVADGLNYSQFFKELNLEDTLFSWFLITELHVWMIMVRVMAEGDDGRFVRNNIVEAMWSDVSSRIKKLGAALPSSDLKDQLIELNDQFQAAIIGYDEGLLSDDRVLAGAVWRRFFCQNHVDPRKVECLVAYIRKQIQSLDRTPFEALLVSPVVQWLPLDSIKETEVHR